MVPHPAGTKVVYIGVEEDETLSRRDILGGPSGGLGETNVRFRNVRTGVNVRADDPQIQGALSNIWVLWLHEEPA
jgi:hypothetical protein